MEKRDNNYKVGISTGFYYIGNDPALLGLATKIGALGATGGVQFVQVDLESIAEFREPEVVAQVKRMMSKLGITDVGLHGEIGENMSVDCAEKRVWDQTHDRLVQTVKFAADLGFRYVNVHFSARPILSFTESQQRSMGYMYPVVGPDGRSLAYLVKGNPETEKEAVRHVAVRGGEITQTDEFREELKKYVESHVKQHLQEEVERIIYENTRGMDDNQKKEWTNHNRKEIEKRAEAELKNRFAEQGYGDKTLLTNVWVKLKDTAYEKFLLSDGELGAYSIVAHYMKEKGDYLWNNIANGKEPEKLFFDNEQAYCAAVTSKYIEGHLNVTGQHNDINKKYLGGMSIKQWCEAKKLYLCFENPEANRGQEGAYRLFHPQHYYHTIKNIGSPFVRICLDVEHMVSHALDPDVEIPKLPDDFGKYMVLWHLGQATPYGGTSHIPIARGSIPQEQIYRWIYWIKKKGFANGYLLFERGGGRRRGGQQNYEVFEDSVQALRQIAEYLEKDVAPTHLPPEFFGVSASNKEVWARQVTTIKEHALDPTEGLLSVPEEKHTFLGRVAVEKGKAQEWERRKFR